VTTPAYVRRFRRAAGIAAAVAVILAVALLSVLIVVIPRRDMAGDAILVVVSLALGAVIAVSVVGSRRRAQAIHRVSAQHPGGLVILARRQPSLVSDLAVYLADRGITANVADGWQIGLVDERGISVWSTTPAELLLMPWSELGSIEVTDLESGGKARGIAVDVRPFDTPLIVAIGYAAFGLTGSLGRTGVAEVAALANGLRPAAVE
jgi:hypothetical protein